MQPVRLPVLRDCETGRLTRCIAASRGRKGPQTLTTSETGPAGRRARFAHTRARLPAGRQGLFFVDMPVLMLRPRDPRMHSSSAVASEIMSAVEQATQAGVTCPTSAWTKTNTACQPRCRGIG